MVMIVCRQVEAHARSGDILWSFSTREIEKYYKAISTANAYNIAFGRDGGLTSPNFCQTS